MNRPFPDPSPSPLHRRGISQRRTPHGWRLSQHGTVLSEVRLQPSPTHSVFDVLASACVLDPQPRDIALLGFGGGSVVAALRALGSRARIHTVDLDPTGRNLLREARASWVEPLTWRQADAFDWLRRSGRFDVIIDDLSIPRNGDVEKPDGTWTVLPNLARRHLRPGGRVLFNLLRPPGRRWSEVLSQVTEPFSSAITIIFDDFENRIVVASKIAAGLAPTPISPRPLGRALRSHLRSLNSRLHDRIRVEAFP